ncbi:MAG: tetratricopeptide repeat protein [Candidatus Rokuibacteriota bacterium]
MRQRRGTIVLLLFVSGVLAAGPLWAEDLSPERAIRLQQRKLQRKPRDAAAYYKLGDAYVWKARESGDMSYFTLAEQALRKSLQLAPRSAGAARHLAFVLVSRHEFRAAVAQAMKAIELDPADADAYGVLGDAHLELGGYEQAADAYHRMIQLRRDLASYGRLSGLKNLRGDTLGAIEDLQRAIDAGQADGQPRESIAWAQWQLGAEHFAVGDVTEAETRYLEALRTYPTYHRALAGLAQVRTAQRRYADAIDLYEKAIAIIPQPDYVAALGDVFAKTGRRDAAQRQYDLVEYMGRLSAINQVVYNRELAYFYANHDVKLPEALDLARREYHVRQDIYASDLLAWTLYKNGKAEDAVGPMAAALRLGTKDAKLHFHAGMIYDTLGQTAVAWDHLRRALDLNPHFDLFQAELAARALSRLAEGRGP